jgi:hypothetical protein
VTNTETTEETMQKAIKLLLYKETEKNQKLRETYRQVFGVDFDEKKIEEELNPPIPVASSEEA